MEAKLEQISFHRTTILPPPPPPPPAQVLPSVSTAISPPPLPAAAVQGNLLTTAPVKTEEPPPQPAIQSNTLSTAVVPPRPARLQTSTFDSPSMLWYDNPPSFIDNIPAQVQPDAADYIDHPTLMKIRNTSASRKHFSSLIVRAIFTEEERSTSNVSGRKKSKLDPHRIAFVKQKAFQMYPMLAGEKADKAWAECVVAIDELNRRLNRKIKQPAQ